MSDDLDKLFRAARRETPNTSRVEHAFETRLLARLRQEREQPALWVAMTWKLIPYFAAVVVALGVWNVSSANSASLDLRAAIDDGDTSWLSMPQWTGGFE